MTYLLTVWLIWSHPFDAVLVEYEAESCAQAITEVHATVLYDGVTEMLVVSCERLIAV